MSKMLQELVNRNADACEQAKHPRCRCHCWGALHGAAHSAEWRKQIHDELETSHYQQGSHALALLGLFVELRNDNLVNAPDPEPVARKSADSK